GCSDMSMIPCLAPATRKKRAACLYSMLLLKLSNFKSGAAVISPEKHGFQAHSARASAPATAGAIAVFNGKPLQCPEHDLL
ncbi:MAG: hypothetical protein K2O70_11320, partial [Desulfovibrionaceae bacterium]|nr:hypothetical protein [Desulfovibrionaceae bacterium]